MDDRVFFKYFFSGLHGSGRFYISEIMYFCRVCFADDFYNVHFSAFLGVFLSFQESPSNKQK